MSVDLSDEEREKVEAVHQAVADKLQETPEVRQWCTQTTVLRYLRARNWNVAAATKMLKGTLDWRTSYKPHRIQWQDVEEEAKTGKLYVAEAADKDGRPVVVMRPRNENSRNTERQIKFLVYHLELASRRAEELGVEKMTWLIDFEGYTMRNAPPIKVSVHTTLLLHNHYPERLGLAICYHPPRIFSLTYKATSPFIDPVTKQKIFFVEKNPREAAIMAEKFNMDQLEECLGGHSTWHFDYMVYSTAMRREDDSLRQAIEASM